MTRKQARKRKQQQRAQGATDAKESWAAHHGYRHCGGCDSFVAKDKGFEHAVRHERMRVFGALKSANQNGGAR